MGTFAAAQVHRGAFLLTVHSVHSIYIGYRSILDAMKSFAVDSGEPACADIEASIEAHFSNVL